MKKLSEEIDYTRTPSCSCGICQAPAYWDGRFHICGANPGHIADSNTGIFSDCSLPTPAGSGSGSADIKASDGATTR